jgi:GH15 family glucan-1,4-alpha-glucosidase
MPRATYEGPYREAVDRSILVLRALTYRTNGTILAAPTTSLPETVGEERQWDYRFAWIRDASFAAEALLEVGDLVAARRVMGFFLNCIELDGKPFAAPFFHVDGTIIRGERDLGWLPGFRGSRPCREGNAATGQVQLDVEGDFLWVLYRYYALTEDRLYVRAYWQEVSLLAAWTVANWRLQDASLWEFRGADADYTHSKLMCWTALHYAAELAKAIGEPRQAVVWEREAGRVREAIETRAVVPGEGRYGQAFGSDRTDAALLLLPIYGFCAVDDPVFLATLRAIERDLVKDDWVYRYTGDMMGAAAHPFLIASSWLSRVYSRLGRIDRARSVLERLLSGRTDLGLLGEHVDMETGEPRGNFPQAFSHLGIVMAAVELQRAEEAQAARSLSDEVVHVP